MDYIIAHSGLNDLSGSDRALLLRAIAADGFLDNIKPFAGKALRALASTHPMA